jgi:hypothetical protein
MIVPTATAKSQFGVWAWCSPFGSFGLAWFRAAQYFKRIIELHSQLAILPRAGLLPAAA